MAQGSGLPGCTRGDWKGDTETAASILLIESRKETGREWGCILSSARPSPDGAVARFKCGGEGMDGIETQKIAVHNTQTGRILILKTAVSNMTSQDGPHNNRPVPHDSKEKTEIYKYCP
jgi:hypothetical protein